MSKEIDTKRLVPEILPNVEIKTLNTLVCENFKAEELLSWFVSDSQNFQRWASIVFKGGFDKDDLTINSLINAINKSIQEIEEDIVKIKECLAEYVPPNN